MMPLTLESERLFLRTPTVLDATDYAEYQSRNRVFFERWGPLRTEEFFTSDWWKNALQEVELTTDVGRVLAFGFYLRKEPGRLIGTCKFDQIVRGVFQSSMLGYGIDEECSGQGYMTEGLRVAIQYVFGVLNLHRVQANHLRENVRSASLLARLGFVREGVAPQYLFINGAWRDHVLNSLINSNFDHSRIP